MLELLLDVQTHEKMREFVQYMEQPSKITGLMKEMQAANICFTPEIINDLTVTDFDATALLSNETAENKSLLCYKKLMWIKTVNPVVSVKVNKIIKMFGGSNEV